MSGKILRALKVVMSSDSDEKMPDVSLSHSSLIKLSKEIRYNYYIFNSKYYTNLYISFQEMLIIKMEDFDDESKFLFKKNLKKAEKEDLL